jgi:uncharacterized protein (DUF4415 family)
MNSDKLQYHNDGTVTFALDIDTEVLEGYKRLTKNNEACQTLMNIVLRHYLEIRNSETLR